MDQQHHAPAATPCDAHSERQSALCLCARRGISRSVFFTGGGDETGGAHPPAARAATRIQSGGAITALSQRAAAVASAEPGAPFSVAGADGEAISAAAREWPLLFLGSTKRERLSGARAAA